MRYPFRASAQRQGVAAHERFKAMGTVDLGGRALLQGGRTRRGSSRSSWEDHINGSLYALNLLRLEDRQEQRLEGGVYYRWGLGNGASTHNTWLNELWST